MTNPLNVRFERFRLSKCPPISSTLKPACDINEQSARMVKNRMCGSRHGSLTERSSPRGFHIPRIIWRRIRRNATFGTVTIIVPPGRRTLSASCITLIGSNRCSRTSNDITQSKDEPPKGNRAGSATVLACKFERLCCFYGFSGDVGSMVVNI